MEEIAKKLAILLKKQIKYDKIQKLGEAGKIKAKDKSGKALMLVQIGQ